MPKITQIRNDNSTQRVVIYIDYRFCASIRQSVWQTLNLQEGAEISCAELHRREKLAWQQYSKINSINTSRVTINRVLQWISKYLSQLRARVIDFRYGQNNSDLFSGYPLPRSDQNISLLIKGTNIEVITLEVMGAGIQRGLNYWVKEEIILHAQSQDKRDAWVVLHHRQPKESFIWIKPYPEKHYRGEELIRGNTSLYILFSNDASEVHTSKEFCAYIQNKVDGLIEDHDFRGDQ